jgi:hypothetical protein
MRKQHHLEERLVDGRITLGKDCGKCAEWKPLEMYANKKTGLGGKQPKCKACCKLYYEETSERLKEKRDTKKDIKAEQGRQLYQKKREQILAQRKKYHQENPGYYTEWNRRNPEKTYLKQKKRLEIQKHLDNSLTQKEEDEIKKIFNGKCALSGKTGTLHMDHVIPVCTGHGGFNKRNVAPILDSLNFSKQDQNLFEWYELNHKRLDLPPHLFEKLITHLSSMNGMSISEYKDYVFDCHENKRNFFEGEAI